MARSSSSINKSQKNGSAAKERKSKLTQELENEKLKQGRAKDEEEKNQYKVEIERLENLLKDLASVPDSMDVDKEEDNDDKGGDGNSDENKEIKKEETESTTQNGPIDENVEKNTGEGESATTRQEEQKDSAAESHDKGIDHNERNMTEASRGESVSNDTNNASANDSSAGSPLFVRPKSPPQDDKKFELDEDGQKALFVRHTLKHSEHFQTVGWGRGTTTFYINRHGRKSASKYRLESFAESAEYEERERNDEDPYKVTNSENRYGDKKLPSGKWRYTKRHIIGIWGVAWACPIGCQNDLNLINPDIVEKWPTTYVLIMWDIDGNRKKSWETRSSLRNRWTKKDADDAIYRAACEAEARYNDTEAGLRAATSRSPSRGLAEVDTARFRAQSHDVGNQGRSVRFQDTDDLSDALADFKASYAQLLGKSFSEMSIKEKSEMVSAWQVQKDEMAG
ncbi:hypothetical protein ACHAPB_009214 [Verticillium nonalfalfae]